MSHVNSPITSPLRESKTILDPVGELGLHAVLLRHRMLSLCALEQADVLVDAEHTAVHEADGNYEGDEEKEHDAVGNFRVVLVRISGGALEDYV